MQILDSVLRILLVHRHLFINCFEIDQLFVENDFIDIGIVFGLQKFQ
jgi:hypothetical protein